MQYMLYRRARQRFIASAELPATPACPRPLRLNMKVFVILDDSSVVPLAPAFSNTNAHSRRPSIDCRRIFSCGRVGGRLRLRVRAIVYEEQQPMESENADR